LVIGFGLYTSSSSGNDNIWIQIIAWCVFILPGILIFAVTLKQRIVIQLDENGIFYYGKFITNWKNFQAAYLREEYISEKSISRRYYIYIHYLDSVSMSEMQFRIPMFETLNRAEEDI